ncbi:oxygenase MpaB family protein [Spirosoma sp. SC4-14]|uniref:oxygenase MpaB family protein n=1 Tax=Spirosoma sp. SC4-14 TaxID=3128900 RepID=UPI0030CB866D
MPTLIKPPGSFTDELLQPYRQQGDVPADAVIMAIVEAKGHEGLRPLMNWLADPEAVSFDSQGPQVLRDFFETYTDLPTWADTRQMAKGMTFFQKHAQQIALVLGCFSLPYCYLGANGAQVLWLTERIKNDTARRLHETGEWIFSVNDPREWNTKTAIFRTLKVRLIHAAVRWFSLHSGRWQMVWGYPVNQEDMAGTNLAFSYIVLRGLRKLGIVASEAEEEAYLHHINVIGFLNGVSDELIPQNLRQAYLLDRAIARRQFAVSEAGQGLTRALLDAIAKQGSLALASQSGSQRPEAVRNLIAGEMRFFLGDHYADWLGIPDAPVEKRLAGLVGRLPIFPNKKS